MVGNRKIGNRITWIDNAKAIGIFVVLLGHVPFLHNSFKIWIYSFHMPLFFFLAGVTFKTNNIDAKTLFKKKFKGLIVPYYIFSAFALIWSLCQGNFSDGVKFDFLKLAQKTFGVAILQIRGGNLGNHIWFPSCLLISFLLLFLIVKTKFNLRVLLVLCSLIIGYIYAEIIGKPLPWGIDAALIAVAFLFMGNTLSAVIIKTLDSAKPIKLILIAGVGGGANLLFAVLNYILSGIRVDIWNCNYGNLPLFLLSSISGIIAVLAISKLISCGIIAKFGQNSLYYYGMHQPILVLLCSFIPQKSIAVDLLSGLLATFAVILILVPLKGIYDKILSFCTKTIKLS